MIVRSHSRGIFRHWFCWLDTFYWSFGFIPGGTGPFGFVPGGTGPFGFVPRGMGPLGFVPRGTGPLGFVPSGVFGSSVGSSPGSLG